MSVSTNPNDLNYIGLINKSVYSTDDCDIGDIYAINKHFLVVKKGFINIHYYYIPFQKVEGWDGNVLWLKITDDEVKKKYERNVFPDTERYYIKGFRYENFPPYFPKPELISKRYRDENFEKVMRKNHLDFKYLCDLCNVPFDTENDFDKHMLETHK